MKTLILLLLPVLAWAQALNITTTSLDSSTWGTAYQDTVVATGGTAPYIFRVFDRVLPTGAYLRGDGYVLGTPTDTAGGGKTFSVSVTDAAGARDVQELTLGVKDSTTLAPSAPTLNVPADGRLGVGIDTLLAWNDVTGETKYHIQLDTDRKSVV
jgi:hypothetical protein